MSSHRLIEQLDLDVLPKKSSIIEVGSQREAVSADDPANSSVWLLRLAERLGMGFETVDFSRDTYERAVSYVGERAHLADGATFISEFAGRISILYLDNFDVVYNEQHKASLLRRVGAAYEAESLTNERSAEVHLGQVLAALPKMTDPAYIGFDDTIIREGGWWGKGAKAVPHLLSLGWAVLARGEDGVFLRTPDNR